MDTFKKHIELSKLSDVHRDLSDADKMVDNCDPKIIDTLCRLDTFLNKHKESRDASEYNVVFKDTKRVNYSHLKAGACVSECNERVN